MLAKSILAGAKLEELKIFYSYSRKNNQYRAALDRVLSEYQWDVAVRPWHDGEIPPGSILDEEINRQIRAADIILLFITNQFMQSKYCRDVELSTSLHLHKEGKARVIPIILEETNPDWRKSGISCIAQMPDPAR